MKLFSKPIKAWQHWALRYGYGVPAKASHWKILGQANLTALIAVAVVKPPDKPIPHELLTAICCFGATLPMLAHLGITAEIHTKGSRISIFNLAAEETLGILCHALSFFGFAFLLLFFSPLACGIFVLAFMLVNAVHHLAWIEAAEFIELKKEGKILRKGYPTIIAESKEKVTNISQVKLCAVTKTGFTELQQVDKPTDENLTEAIKNSVSQYGNIILKVEGSSGTAQFLCMQSENDLVYITSSQYPDPPQTDARGRIFGN